MDTDNMTDVEKEGLRFQYAVGQEIRKRLRACAHKLLADGKRVTYTMLSNKSKVSIAEIRRASVGDFLDDPDKMFPAKKKVV